jgi:hypothetical protein
MKKAILATVFGISLSAALAVDWNVDDDVTLIADDGTIVGVGEMDDDGLELDVLAGFSGFVRLDAGGEIIDAVVNTDGTITLFDVEGFVELDDDLAGRGFNLQLTPEDTLAGVVPQTVVVTPTPNRDDDDDDMDDDDNGSSPVDTNRDDDDDDNDDNGSSGSDDNDDGRNDDDDDDNGSGGSSPSSGSDNDDDDDNDDD